MKIGNNSKVLFQDYLKLFFIQRQKSSSIPIDSMPLITKIFPVEKLIKQNRSFDITGNAYFWRFCYPVNKISILILIAQRNKNQ